jgi:hypothetical protein
VGTVEVGPVALPQFVSTGRASFPIGATSTSEWSAGSRGWRRSVGGRNRRGKDGPVATTVYTGFSESDGPAEEAAGRSMPSRPDRGASIGRP